MEMNALIASAAATLLAVAWKVIGALFLWLAGRSLINFAVRVLRRALADQRFDPTLTLYFERGLSVLLNVILIVALLGFFGVETTSFAALLAAGGVAIGVASGGRRVPRIPATFQGRRLRHRWRRHRHGRSGRTVRDDAQHA